MALAKQSQSGAGRLVGRADLLRALAEQIADNARVVTLVGPPGVGKSRVAREWAATWVAKTGEQSLQYCDLGGVRDAAAGAATLAQALPRRLGAQRAGANLIEIIARFAKTTPTVLVLDNIDHVVRSGRLFVEEILARAPELQIVATSREQTQLAQEIVIAVEPLDLEDAVELFIQRSGGRISARRTPRKTRLVVTEVVRRVSCLPLAIELAASRLSVLSVEQLAERLRCESLAITASSSAGGDRHASLAQTIRWSWELLTETERNVLAQLSVFGSSFTVADAEAVLVVASESVLNTISSLAIRSLIQSDRQGHLRLLDPIRDFAAREHREGQWVIDVDRRFASYLVIRAEKLTKVYRTGRGREALLELETLASDLMAVHNRMSKVEPAFAIRAALTLVQPMRSAGGGDDYEKIFTSAKELALTLGDQGLLARSHFACGLAGLLRGDLAVAADDFKASAAIAEAAGDALIEADARIGIGALLLTDDEEVAKANWDLARERYSACQDHLGVGNASANLALLALEQGNLPAALERVEASIDAFERVGLVHRLAFPLLVRAATLGEKGETDAAERDSIRALEIAREIHHRGHEVEARSQLALIEWKRGNVTGALLRQTESRTEATEDAVAASCLVLAVMRGLCGDKGGAESLLREAEASLGTFRGRNGLELYRTCKSLITGVGKTSPESSFLARAVCRIAEQHSTSTQDGEPLVVGADARWFQVGARPRVSLGRRMILRRLVLALTAQRIDEPGKALTALDLQERLWPEQNIMPDTAANRLYVTVSKLRSMGLRRHLLTDGDGYLFAPLFDVFLNERE